MQGVNLLWWHPRRAAPIGPMIFVGFIIVCDGVKVNNGVDETQNEAICSPVYNKIDSKVVFVERYFVSVNPVRTWALITELSPNRRQPRIANADG